MSSGRRSRSPLAGEADRTDNGFCFARKAEASAIQVFVGLLPQPGGFEDVGAVEEDLQPRNPSIPNRPEVEDIECVQRGLVGESAKLASANEHATVRPIDELQWLDGHIRPLISDLLQKREQLP